MASWHTRVVNVVSTLRRIMVRSPIEGGWARPHVDLRFAVLQPPSGGAEHPLYERTAMMLQSSGSPLAI